MESDPQARTLLLRTLLADEFLLLPERVFQLGESVSQLRQEFTEFRSETTQRFDSLEGRFDGLEGRFDGLEGRFDGLEGRFDQVEGRVANLQGANEEREVARRVHSVISQPLDLRRTRVVLSIGESTSRELLDPIEDARDENLITEQQFRRILSTDLIFTARRRVNGFTEPDPTWYAVEISVTVEDIDVTRAIRSANALEQATGARSVPIVAGSSIIDTAQVLAENHEVFFAQVSDQ